MTQIEVGAILDGTVSSIAKFGAFVNLPERRSGLVHISEIASEYVADVNEFLQVGQAVKVKVLAITPEGKIRKSPPPRRAPRVRRPSAPLPRAAVRARPRRRASSMVPPETPRLRISSSDSCRSPTAASPATGSTATETAAAEEKDKNRPAAPQRACLIRN